MATDQDLKNCFTKRFGSGLESDIEDVLALGLKPKAIDTLLAMASRSSCRYFDGQPIPISLLRILAATALSAPSKSDLQQADIVNIQDQAQQARLGELVPAMPWIKTAPALLVFCGNNRRIRQIAKARGHTFANDHLDAFFNASVDAGIVLSSFVRAAETVGLGCCPISVLRNESQKVSDILCLPDHVFAVAGLAVGWPANTGTISPRLNLQTTLHVDQFTENADDIQAYDQRRNQTNAYGKKRNPDIFEEVADYGWSEDKARQYAMPERTGFGAFIRAKGFNLD